MAKKWIITPPSPHCGEASRRWDVPRLVAQLLINRGVDADDPDTSFLSPRMSDLHPPELLHDADKAADLIVQAIQAGEKIAIYGDYDVDGTTGVAILWHMLKHAGADVVFYVPHRIDEGYGLNIEAVRNLISEGTRLIVSVDCGVTAQEVAEEVAKTDATLVITDHHALPDTLPPAAAIVHPLVGGTYPNPNLCGAGVAFKLAWAIARKLSGSDRVDPELRALLVEMLPLAALGTIADVVPLVGENRIIARHGLGMLGQTKLPGLRALIESAGLDPASINGTDVGFKLAPRINAAGRMGHARLAIELLTRADETRGREIALYLEEHNKGRQAIERKITKQANEMIEREGLASDARRALVLCSNKWHPGVIGIVASRMVERYQRPTVLIAVTDDVGQGSARSVRHLNMAKALTACGEHLLSFGGHAMAGGLRIEPANVPAFTEAFVEFANNQLTGDDLVPKLRLDAEVFLEDLTLETVQAVGRMEPFGNGNPKPKLATDWVELAAEPRLVGARQDHLQASFRHNGVSIRGIGFGLGSAIQDLKEHRRCRVAFEPMINEFRGQISVEMRILDLKFEE